jgi:hypothetical protein
MSCARAANTVIQSSQMYDVTVVGLEVQVPRTASYILHPCDLRILVTRRLPAKAPQYLTFTILTDPLGPSNKL